VYVKPFGKPQMVEVIGESSASSWHPAWMDQAGSFWIYACQTPGIMNIDFAAINCDEKACGAARFRANLVNRMFTSIVKRF
jgi:hypothetical protein